MARRLWNTGLEDHMVSQPRRPQSTSSPLQEHKVSENGFSLCQPSLLCSKGTMGSFPSGKVTDQCMKMTTHIHLVLWLGMHGTLPPLPQMYSWCDA
jgi:hypothetical protein